MKKGLLIALCAILLCSLCVAISTPVVKAYKAGYEVTDYVGAVGCTVDGKWTDNLEWTDAEEKQLDGSLNATFRLKYQSNYPTSVNQYYLIEFFDDTTPDAGDYMQLSYEAPVDVGGTPIGGSAPQTDCILFNYTGHAASGFQFYKGDGSAWVASTAAWGTSINIVDSIGSSPKSSTPHLMIEVMVEHMAFSIGTPQWIRVAVYDASQSSAGVQAWPESSVTVPNDWGVSNAIQEAIPEGLGIGLLVLMSSVSVFVGFIFLRKRPNVGIAR
jgi:hypothetical protein